jgi:adenine-specific DNA-methyltransferase
MVKKQTAAKTVESLKHDEARRKNIPTAEYQSVLQKAEQSPVKVGYDRRNRDLDPQLMWRGKDEQDWSDLVVHAPPLYIQEKVQPKALIDELLRETRVRENEAGQTTADLFADFNGIPKGVDKTDFYQHDQNWSNRMILGDSLQAMASLAEREGLRGKVQCIYFDPPYGIKFNSNFQWSTTSRDVKDGNPDHITREPEQVKAFRDTWRDGVHSYLTYLRDRLTVARDLLTDSGSIFVQIGDENVHRLRTLLDEVFGDENYISSIVFTKSSAGLQASTRVASISDTLLWYSKNAGSGKFRRLLEFKGNGYDPQYNTLLGDDGSFRALTQDEKDRFPSDLDLGRLIQPDNLTKPGPGAKYSVEFRGRLFNSGNRWWGTTEESMQRLLKTGRVVISGSTLRYARKFLDSRYAQLTNIWTGFLGQTNPTYVVQTNTEVVQRCILMTTDPGDIVLDPTCGSGTTATVSEQWGRRWITIDTSRVALALARARIMGARYSFYLLADSREGQIKESEITRTVPSSQPTHGNIRHGFVYERVPHITLKAIAHNAEIDVISDKWQAKLEPLRESLNAVLKRKWRDWEIPREAEEPWDSRTQELFYELESEQARNAGERLVRVRELLEAINKNLKRTYTLETLPKRPADPWPEAPAKLHADWCLTRFSRQQEIDKSIASKAEFECLYDKPYEDKKKVRVAGPFTVESLSPHRVLGVDENDELIDPLKNTGSGYSEKQTFAQMILDNLKISGVQQAHREDRITFTALTPWPGDLVCAEGRYMEGSAESGSEKRAAIFIGPEFGTVTRPDLVEAAREAGDADFDVLIACAFNYEGHATEFNKLGRIPVLKARMNADLHMAEDLKNTGKGNLFVIFGEPDITVITEKDGKLRVKVNGVDVFKPQTGEVVSDGADGIACWFIDTDYNEESFFVRQAYFLGANDPYTALRSTLKAEIDPEAWATLNSDTSRAFEKPKSARIAVKVINHLGDEVMKVFKV